MHRIDIGFILFLALTPAMNSKLYASTFFSPDSDTALLFQLVTTTASQLNELEKLVTNAQKYTEQMQRYNEIAQDHYYRAERIHYIAQNYVELSKHPPASLEELNSAIRNLKSETQSLKSLIDEYRVNEISNQSHEKEIQNLTHKNLKEVAFANHQLNRTGHIKSTNEAQKLTAQNTALVYKSQVEGNQLSQLVASKLSEQNKLLNRNLKEGKKAELEKEKYYAIKKGGKR